MATPIETCRGPRRLEVAFDPSSHFCASTFFLYPRLRQKGQVALYRPWYALNGEARRLTREEKEEQPNLHFALEDRTEAIDEGEVCVSTCFE